MFNYNLKTAFRFIKRNLAFSLINILGLSLGIALVIISMLWIRFESGLDNFHQNADRIFRVVVQFNKGNYADNFAQTPAPLGDAMKNDIPEVIDYVRFGTVGRTLVSVGKKQFWEEIDLADPSLFNIFSFELLPGDPENALRKPNSIILSETKAVKYFGSADPLGQILQLGYEKTPFTITGIMKDIPDNSQLQFDFLSSFSNLTSNLDWGMWNYSTYILAQNKNSINYMNLATARYIRRGKEVGLRKVAGASNSDLTVQFLFESFAMTLSAFILAVLMCTLILPVFNSLTGLNMHLESFFHFSSILLMIVLLLLVTFLAGSYPAFILSSLNPASAVHYDFKLANNLSVKGLRKTLVIFQFIVAIVLIACTIIIQSQLTFIRNKDLGLSPDQVVVVPIFQDDIKLKYELYKNEVLTNPSVLDASAVNYFPGPQGFRQNVWWEGLQKNDNSNMIDWIPVDQDFISTLKIELVKGEFFPRNISIKGSSIYVLNESAVKEIGWDDPIGKQFDIVGKGEVVGVVRDF